MSETWFGVGASAPLPDVRPCRLLCSSLYLILQTASFWGWTHAFIASPIGVMLLFGWSVAFFYHLCSGIRHLAWDAGYGFDISTTYRSGYAVLAATIVLTVLAWLYVFLA
jgi:succinate dehydrogenase / fumarate reductase, cytochrome b subunit